MESNLRKQISECHWCANQIERSAPEFVWQVVGRNWQKDCSFHPIAWDEAEFKETGLTAGHMTTQEVYDLVRNEFVRRKSLQPSRPITDNVVSIAKRAQRTSRKAAEKLQPSAGTMRYEIWLAVKNNNGLTDYELETLLRGKHQTVSASRRSLVIDGWLVDSGFTRKNTQGNDCIVWVINRSLTQGALL